MANLQQAAEKIGAVVSLVNEATRAAEEKQRLINLEASIESPFVKSIYAVIEISRQEAFKRRSTSSNMARQGQRTICSSFH